MRSFFWLRRHLLADLSLATLCLFTLSKLVQLRVPGFAMSHYYFTYEYGLIKRGFIGTLLLPINLVERPESYQLFINWMSFLLVGILAYLLYLRARDFLQQPHSFSLMLLCAALLLSSSFVSQIAFFVGYFDTILALLTLLLLKWLREERWALLVGGCFVGMLIHELFLFFGFPVLLFALFQPRKAWWFRRVFSIAVAMLIAAGSVMLWLVSSDVHPQLLYNAVQRGFNIEPVLMRSYLTYANQYKMNLLPYRLLFSIAVTIIPAAVFVAWVGLVRIRQLRLMNREKLLYMAMFLATVFAPLGPMFVAWDIGRFAGYTLFHGLLALGLVFQVKHEEPLNPERWHKWTLHGVGWLFVVFNCFNRFAMLDGSTYPSRPPHFGIDIYSTGLIDFYKLVSDWLKTMGM